MNWGGFAGGFSQGFGNGVRIGTQFKSAMKEKELEDLRAKGIDEAKAAREGEIAGMIKDNGPTAAPSSTTGAGDQPSATPSGPITDITPDVQASPVTPAAEGISAPTPLPQSAAITPQAEAAGQTPTASAAITPQAQQTKQSETSGGIQQQAVPMGRYMVGAQGFDSIEQARAAAEKKVPSVNDYIINRVVPKMQEHYITNGDVVTAEKLGQYMESRKGKEATAIFGKAMTSMLTGDTDGGVKQFGEYYNKFIDDGVDFKSHSIGEDGKLNIVVRRKGDDKDSTLSLTRGELIRLGAAHDPVKMHAQLLDAQKAQEAQQSELAKESRDEARDMRKEGRTEKREIAKEGRTQNYKLEEKTIDSQLDAAKPGEIGKKVRDLRRLGWGEERIEQFLDKDSEHKRTTNPTERRALVVSDLTKNDPMFGRKSKEEQSRQVDQVMSVIYGDAQGTTPASAASGTPAAGGLPPKKGVPFYDPKTGTVSYR